MSVKIRLKRLGKVRVPQYRIVVVDSRKKRDGKVIEEIGKYHPKEDPSYISVVSDRAQYWLGVGAQPSDAVAKILKITGDWQTYKGLKGTEGTLKVAEPKRDKLDIFNEALKDAHGESSGEAVTKKAAAKKAPPRRPPRSRPRTRLLRRLPLEVAAEAPAEAVAEEAEPPRSWPRRLLRWRPLLRPPRPRPTRQAREVGRRQLMLAEALEHLVRGIVDNPDEVSVRDKELRRGSILEVRVHPDDLGKVIGRGGRTATAFRTVVSALAGRGGARIDFVDVDRRR